jgi:hypothetical protein
MLFHQPQYHIATRSPRRWSEGALLARKAASKWIRLSASGKLAFGISSLRSVTPILGLIDRNRAPLDRRAALWYNSRVNKHCTSERR